MKLPRLYKKRAPDEPGYREAPWYCIFQYHGTRYPRCLETPDKTVAAQRARQLRERIVRTVQLEDWPALDRIRVRAPAVGSLGQLFTAYRQLADIASADANIWALRTIIRAVHGPELTDDQIDALPCSNLTSGLLEAYKRNCVDPQAPFDDTKRSAITSCNSRIRQARSILKRSLLVSGAYKAAGVRLPDLVGFKNVLLFKQPKHPFVPIPQDIVAAIWTASAKLREDDPNAYRAFLLAECCGLRRGEAARLRWSEVHQLAVQPTADNPAPSPRPVARLGITKSGHPRMIPLDLVKTPSGRTAYDELRDLARVLPIKAPTDPAANAAHPGRRDGPNAPTDYVLDGHWSDRYSYTFARLSAWLRALGWQRRKVAHEFRKHFGSMMAEKYGTRTGALLLGNTEKVFAAHYDALLQLPG